MLFCPGSVYIQDSQEFSLLYSNVTDSTSCKSLIKKKIIKKKSMQHFLEIYAVTASDTIGLFLPLSSGDAGDMG